MFFDAQGRMAMVDVLCHMREKAVKEVNPHLMTFATLTGHAGNNKHNSEYYKLQALHMTIFLFIRNKLF